MLKSARERLAMPALRSSPKESPTNTGSNKTSDRVSLVIMSNRAAASGPGSLNTASRPESPPTP